MSDAQTVQVQRASPLQSGQGTTKIADIVVTKVVTIAAQEIDGVTLGGGSSRSVTGILDSVTGGGASASRGVSVEVGEVEAAVDLTLSMDYGKRATEIASAVRKNVITRVEDLLGLRVTEVNIQIGDIIVPQDRQRQAQSAQDTARVQ